MKTLSIIVPILLLVAGLVWRHRSGGIVLLVAAAVLAVGLSLLQAIGLNRVSILPYRPVFDEAIGYVVGEAAGRDLADGATIAVLQYSRMEELPTLAASQRAGLERTFAGRGMNLRVLEFDVVAAMNQGIHLPEFRRRLAEVPDADAIVSFVGLPETRGPVPAKAFPPIYAAQVSQPLETGRRIEDYWPDLRFYIVPKTEADYRANPRGADLERIFGLRYQAVEATR